MTDGPKVSSVTDHPFKPRGAWYTTCGHMEPIGSDDRVRSIGATRRCGLAEAAHVRTTLIDPWRPPVKPKESDVQEP